MKKIVGFITVLTVFSWVTTANAGPLVVDIQSSSGVLTIDGFANPSPQNLNFLFNFADTNLNSTPFINGDSGIFNVIQPVNIGQDYHVHVGFEIPVLSNPGLVFSADFNIESLFALPIIPPGGLSVDTILTGLIAQGHTDFTPTNAFLTVLGDTMQLLSVHVGDVGNNPLNPTLLLTTTVISGTKLTDFLKANDPNSNGSVMADFTNAHAEITVPEPTTLLLMGGGLLGMLGFSKKRA
jgi:hypothetical protein